MHQGAHFKINNVNKFWEKGDTPPYVPLHILGTCMDPPLHMLSSMCCGQPQFHVLIPSGGTRIFEPVGQQQGLKQYGRASNYLG